MRAPYLVLMMGLKFPSYSFLLLLSLVPLLGHAQDIRPLAADPARATLVQVTPETQHFVPYGTPCSERFDPATQKLELLQCEMETMHKRLVQLLEERDATAAKQSAAKKRGGVKRA